jgi:hypothetical protein
MDLYESLEKIDEFSCLFWNNKILFFVYDLIFVEKSIGDDGKVELRLLIFIVIFLIIILVVDLQDT